MPESKFATLTMKLKLLDSADMDYNVEIQKIELDWVIHMVATNEGNCVHELVM
jgi:hypothetical protein